MKVWKQYQKLYASLVSNHSDDRTIQKHVVEDEIINNALAYVKHQDDVAVYPAKSYIVAIIYATLLEKVYKEDFYEVLNDADLFCGLDSFFVPYQQDPGSYDAIIEELKAIPNWLDGGWAPYTVNYFWMECTKEGLETVNKPQE